MTPPTRRRSRNVRRQGNLPLDRVWAAMRMLRSFNGRQLATVSECDYWTVMRFLRSLLRVGYLSKSKGRNKLGESDSFKLLRNTGPLRPHVQTNHIVWDKNLAREFAPETGDE